MYFRVGSSPGSGNRRFSSPLPSMTPPVYSDRFIPSRSSSNLDDALDILDNVDALNSSNISRNSTGSQQENNKEQMNNLLRSELLGHNSGLRGVDGMMRTPLRPSSHVFKYSSPNSSGKSPNSTHSNNRNSYMYSHMQDNETYERNSDNKPPRKISKIPYKVLEAPSLQDDFYLNLVDWSKNNCITVALGQQIYSLSACTSKV